MKPSDLAILKTRLPISPATAARNQPAEAPAGAEPPKPVPLAQTSIKVRETSDVARLNKTERRYLAWLMALGDAWVGVQNITLKIGHDVRLTMDFAAVDASGLRLIDTKACNRKTLKPLCREDAMIKIRTAARAFPFIRFLIAWEDNGIWRHQEITN